MRRLVQADRSHAPRCRHGWLAPRRPGSGRRPRWLRAWLTMLSCLALLLARARPLDAQPKAPDVSATVSAEEVEVGEPFTVELRAWSESNSVPGDPQLYVPNGLEVEGPRVATQFQTRFGTGVNYVKQGIRATWQLVGQRTGSYVIPAPTVVVEGERISAGRSMKVKVVPATGRPRRRPSSDPFGFPTPFGFPGGRSPFGFDFDSLFDREAEDDQKRLDEQAESLAMDAEREPYVFLRAIADRTQVVVGQQVTLSFYVYYRADFEMSDRHEPALADFLRVSMLSTPGTDPPTRTRVGSYRYLVRLLDRVALFPLRAGALRTGTLTARFTGSRVGRSVERASNDITVEVREPPKEGRPTGYRLGDVGTFRLSAEVKPTEITAGGSVAVQVRLQGIGNIPTSLEVPDRAGVEWLDPQIRSDVTVTNGQVGGWRTFGYVVKIEEPGERYLGQITLPYYDPERREYAVAQVDLGNVTVRPGAAGATPTTSATASATGPDGPSDPFGRLAPARLALRAFEREPARGIEPRLFWPLWAAPPFAVLLFGALRRMARRVAARRAARREDPAGLAQSALRDMGRAGDLTAKATSAERALHLAIEGATGVKSRGVLLAELPAALCAAGLASSLADECAAELERCASVRFVPGANGSTSRELERRVRELVRRLGSTPRRAPSRAGQPGASRNGVPPTSAPASTTAARRAGSALVLLGLAGALLLVPSAALGAPASDELFRRGTNALGEGDFDEAIQQLEAMADQGIAHPDASYNRGLAYIARVRAGAERPGDLGRAAAAFTEALALRDDDADAELALEIVEAEVARRGARRGKDVVSERPSLDRLLVQLGSERSWGIAALAASLLLAVGLALRSAKGRPQYIVSRVLPPLALLAMALLTPLYLGARALRQGTRVGVVVVPELYLADEDGRSLGSDAVPEAAKVEVGERRGRMLHVRWGSREGWAALGSVRLIEAE